MNDFDADGPSENEWEEQGELTWTEFDWEKYLREQDNAISRYLGFYEKLQGHPDRIDETARLMGWEEGDWSAETEAEAEAMDESTDEASASDYDSLEPYTLHKNPVFIATKAIYLGLARQWFEIASDPARVAQPIALAFQAALHRGEDQASLAIQALDLGDYAMAVSLFKRALRELNTSLALLDASRAGNHPAVAAFRERTLPRLFDLREIWLRVINECRDELARHIDEEN
jgi:hypothetical protein